MPAKRSAFTLVELLVVLAILSVLAVATLPALRGSLDGVNLSGASAVVDSTISQARQVASTRNLAVELRFYKHDDGTGDEWRAMAIAIPKSVNTLATSDEWISPPKDIPGSVIFDANKSSGFSTIISDAVAYDTTKPGPWTVTAANDSQIASAPGIAKGKDYVAFRFQPDGSTNLPGTEAWCLTIRNPHATGAVAGRPSSNFVAFVIDALTGRSMVFQP